MRLGWWVKFDELCRVTAEAGGDENCPDKPEGKATPPRPIQRTSSASAATDLPLRIVRRLVEAMGSG
jgi:hypothetical protein